MKTPGFTHICLTPLLVEKRSDFLKLVTPLDCADYPNLLEIFLVIMLTGCPYFSIHLVILILPLHDSPIYSPNVDLFPVGFSLEAGLPHEYIPVSSPLGSLLSCDF